MDTTSGEHYLNAEVIDELALTLAKSAQTNDALSELDGDCDCQDCD